MNYTVIWRPVAENTLAHLWTTAIDRAAIAAAADAADALLNTNHNEQGESRWDAVRLMVHGPLSILFEVDDPSLSVFVLAINRSRGL